MDFKKLKIGMRTIKTGLAVALGVTIAGLLGLHNPLFVAIGAISTMQTSVSESFSMGKDRILGTIMGAAVAVAIAQYLPYSNLFLGVGIVVVITILNLLGWKKSISLSAIVFSAVYLNKETVMILYAANRVLDTFIGIVMGVLVNYLVATPDNSIKYNLEVDSLIVEAKNRTYDLIIGKKHVALDFFRDSLTEVEKIQELVRSDSRLISDADPGVKDTTSTLKLLYEIYNDLSAIAAMKYMAVISTKNLKLAGDIYRISPLWHEKSIDAEEDIIFNYHLQRILKNLIRLEK